MTSGILSVVITISMCFGFFSIVKIWVPSICSNATFIKVAVTIIILDVLLLSLWSLQRSIAADDYEKKNRYTH